jgi:formylglycine-generating enzyme required for sulfatase activity
MQLDRSKLGESVRRMRSEIGLEKSELALNAGVKGTDVILRIEAADPTVDTSQLLRVLEILNLNIKEFQLENRPTIEAYPGLRAFREEDVDVFFGRKKMADRIASRLEMSNIVGVIGASGSGKSSVLAAGVIPSLRTQRALIPVTFRPGKKPLTSFSVALSGLYHAERTIQKTKELGNLLTEDPVLVINEIVEKRNPLGCAVILIDQFEELFVSNVDAEEHAYFVRILKEIQDNFVVNAWRCRILFSVRSDFFPYIVNDPQLSDVCQDNLINLPPMSNEELREAIESPAKVLGRKLAPALVELVLSDAMKHSGSLPLVAYCLNSLWRASRDPILDCDSYTKIGGLEGAIAEKSEEVYQSLGKDGQIAMRRLLSRLVYFDDGAAVGAETRKRLSYLSIASDAGERVVAEKLVSARLLTKDFDETDQTDTIEFSHEAVIRSWDRLQGWIQEDRRFLLWQQIVEPQANNWKKSKKDVGLVLRRQLYDEGMKWFEQRHDDMKPLISEFMLASKHINEQEREAISEELAKSLMHSAPSNLSQLIGELKARNALESPRVARLLEDEDCAGVWKLRLAFVEKEPSYATHILKRLEICEPSELSAISRELIGISDIVSDPIRNDLLVTESSTKLLNFSCIYSQLCPDDVEVWSKITDGLSDILVRQSPLHIIDYTTLLQPVAENLFRPLKRNVISTTSDDNTRDASALIFMRFFQDDPKRFAWLLSVCSLNIYPTVFSQLNQVRSFDEKVIGYLSSLVRKQSDSQKPEENLLFEGKAKANAAVTLAKLNRIADAAQVFHDCTDSASQFTFRCKQLAVPAQRIVEQLTKSTSFTQIYWLTIALGEYDQEEIEPVSRNAVVKVLLERYRLHNDPGVHAVSGWLLGLWGINAQDINGEFTRKNPGQASWFSIPGPCGPIPFVRVAEGQFSMGSPSHEAGYKPYEGPVHDVLIAESLAVCARTVTVGEFKEFLLETGRPPLPNIDPFSPDNNHPVVAITWDEAQEFGRWLTDWLDRKVNWTELGNPGIRLPTEAEWECFCRAGTTTAYSFGSDRELLRKFAWYEENSDFKTQPIGCLRPNQFGLFDVHGNCWEWCVDTFNNYIGSAAPQSADNTQQTLKCLRGGCWNLHPRYCRSACRNWHSPGNRNYYTGMRIVF